MSSIFTNYLKLGGAKKAGGAKNPGGAKNAGGEKKAGGAKNDGGPKNVGGENTPILQLIAVPKGVTVVSVTAGVTTPFKPLF